MTHETSQSELDFKARLAEVPRDRRYLFLMCADGYEPALQILFEFQLLADVSSSFEKKLDAVLGYLVRSRLTGQRLCTWVQLEHGMSFLSAVTWVISRLEKSERKPIYADKR